jgi:uncharacterized membrane protein YqjE
MTPAFAYLTLIGLIALILIVMFDDNDPRFP